MKYTLLLVLLLTSCSSIPWIGGSAIPVKAGQPSPDDGYLATAKVTFVEKDATIPFDGVLYSRKPGKVAVDNQEEAIEVIPEK